jgi:branched-chain amino acid transport system permease protein
MHQLLVLTLNGVSAGMVYAALALALVLIWRATRIVNFAQGGMAMFTTFISLSVIEKTGSYWLGFAAALIAGLALGAATERVLIRRIASGPPLNAVILTLGLLLLLQAVVPMIYGGQIRSFPPAFSFVGIDISGTRIPYSPFDIFTLASVLVTMLLLYGLFRFTSIGLQMRASAFAPEVARLLGVRVGRMLTLGWALASMTGALAGVLVAPVVLLSPNSLDPVLVFGFTAAILGGLDSPVGALVGGLALGLALSYVGGYLGVELETAGALLILIVVLMVRPEGIFSIIRHRRV